jgi:hypothetical protein
MSPSLPRAEKYYLLKQEIEEFLYEEAELLDERRFGEWLGLLTEDLIYVMPIRRPLPSSRRSRSRRPRVSVEDSLISRPPSFCTSGAGCPIWSTRSSMR